MLSTLLQQQLAEGRTSAFIMGHMHHLDIACPVSLRINTRMQIELDLPMVRLLVCPSCTTSHQMLLRPFISWSHSQPVRRKLGIKRHYRTCS
jgi:hypothetical protein